MDHFLLVKKKYTVCKGICDTPLLFQLKFDYSKKLIAKIYCTTVCSEQANNSVHHHKKANTDVIYVFMNAKQLFSSIYPIIIKPILNCKAREN